MQSTAQGPQSGSLLLVVVLWGWGSYTPALPTGINAKWKQQLQLEFQLVTFLSYRWISFESSMEIVNLYSFLLSQTGHFQKGFCLFCIKITFLITKLSCVFIKDSKSSALKSIYQYFSNHTSKIDFWNWVGLRTF